MNALSVQGEVIPYPSRQNGAAGRMTDRREPVVYPGQDGPLSKDQLDFFEKNGFLKFEQKITGTVLMDILGEADRLKQRIPYTDERVISEPIGNDIRSVFDIHRLSSIFSDLCQDPDLVAASRQILGSNVYLHQSRINYKPGFQGREFYWHSDFETWHCEDGMPRMRALSCVLLLTENFEYNAPLMIIPGSHKHFVGCPGKTPENHYQKSLKQQQVGVPDQKCLSRLVSQSEIKTMTGKPGTVIFFDCNAMHGSGSNITPHSRNNVFFVYNSVENQLADPICGVPPRPNFIANRHPETIDV